MRDSKAHHRCGLFVWLGPQKDGHVSVHGGSRHEIGPMEPGGVDDQALDLLEPQASQFLNHLLFGFEKLVSTPYIEAKRRKLVDIGVTFEDALARIHRNPWVNDAQHADAGRSLEVSRSESHASLLIHGAGLQRTNMPSSSKESS